MTCLHTPVPRFFLLQDCEDGIPLEYLAGLDACYGNFLRAMSTTGAQVLSIPWASFGDTSVLADAIRGLPAAHPGGWASDMKRVMHLCVCPWPLRCLCCLSLALLLDKGGWW